MPQAACENDRLQFIAHLFEKHKRFSKIVKIVVHAFMYLFTCILRYLLAHTPIVLRSVGTFNAL